ncbi:MAG: hypothetical protein U0232_34025, partial [Thermomicrobiales bacterium]
LPALAASDTIIDGYTQPGAQANSNATGQGTNAVIKIHIQGHPNTTGLNAGINIAGAGNTVRGLSITGFNYNQDYLTFGAYRRGGIYVTGTDNWITGNFIGLLPDGSAASDQNAYGVDISGGHRNTVGGTTPADMNVIGNGAPYGVVIQTGVGWGGGPATGNVVVGNLIGTDPTGTAPRGNSVGVYLDQAKETAIGGTTPAERNVISGNRSYGVRTSDWTGGGVYRR